MFDSRLTVLIVSQSGRALAHSAQKAGLRARVIDLFGDLDTQSVCESNRTVSIEDHGFESDSLYLAAELLDPQERSSVVYGSGFEASPEQLQQLCRRRPLLGNSPDIVATVKEPKSFTKLLDTLGIPYPEIRYTRPRCAENWLSKSNGGSGGGHVRWSRDERVSISETHYQRYVHGRFLSATVLANGSEARVIGYCEQWCDSTSPARPFAYGGAVTLDDRSLSRPIVGAVQEAGQAIVNAIGVRGLWCIDFVADENNWWLIESNPRPGATFELHETGVSLFKRHVEGMYGQLKDLARDCGTTQRGHAIVYAPKRLTVPPDWEWSSWITDRPRAGTVIDEGEPLCSVHAEGASSRNAKMEVEKRRCALMTYLERW